MSFTYTTNVHFAKPSDGDTDHGDEIRQNFDVVDHALAPDSTYFVSPNFTSSNMANTSSTNRRHWDTIQGAIDRINALGNSTAADPYTILVYPGGYAENLTFSTSVHIVGVGGKMNSLSRSNGATPRLTGSATSANSLITVTPPTSQSVAVNFTNFYFENLYAVSNSTEITNPYLLDFQDTGTGGTPHYFGMTDCQARMQTWGDDNNWTWGVKTRGRVITSLMNSDFISLSHGGGEDTGGVIRMFDWQGDGSYKAEMWIDSCSIEAWSLVPAAIEYLFYRDNGTNGRISRSSWYSPSHLRVNGSSTGDNDFAGLYPEIPGEDYGNIIFQTVRF